MATTTIDRLRMARDSAYNWRCELSAVQKVGLVLGMACLTGLAAQVRIPLPWTPIPITGQTFAVLLAGAMLGQWWGGLSMVVYAALGIAGVPWFNGWTGGIAQLAGPTGGYIIGFIFASLAVGYVMDRHVKARKLSSLLVLMTVANIVLIYVPGLLQLGLWLNLVSGKTIGFMPLLAMGFLPFIAGDVIKIVAAALVAWGITPKR